MFPFWEVMLEGCGADNICYGNSAPGKRKFNSEPHIAKVALPQQYSLIQRSNMLVCKLLSIVLENLYKHSFRHQGRLADGTQTARECHYTRL